MMPLDPYPAFVAVAICEPLFGEQDIARQRPGVSAFRAMVLDEWGGRDLGVGRQCDGKPTSAHHESRAWDWGPSEDETLEQWQARAAALIDQLTADGPNGRHELARRFGIRNMIFDKKIRGARQLYEPTTYRGANAHTTHVHFDFSWEGARAQTSGYAMKGGVARVLLPFLATGAIMSLAIWWMMNRRPTRAT